MTEAKTPSPTAFNLALIRPTTTATPITPPQQETPGLARLLRHRPTLNWKRTLSFLSVRKWPNKHRDSIIASFKEAKAENDQALALFAAAEVAQILRPWLAPRVLRDPQFKVTAPPAGVRRTGPHFASMIGQEVARILGIEFAETFVPRMNRGSSFPKKDQARGKMQLLHPVTGGWILVDDISSSASTLESATFSLIASGARAVIPIVWIYGSADKDLGAIPHAEVEGVSDGVLSSTSAVRSDESVENISVDGD